MRIALALAVAATFSAPGLALQDPVRVDNAAQTGADMVETTAAVASMLGDVEANLYQPEQHGLRSLSFELRVEDPMIGHVATAQANWSTAAGSDVSVEVHDFEIPAAIAAMAGGDEAQLAQMKEMISSMLPAQISSQVEGILDNVLNHSVKSIREDYVGSLAGASDDGLVKLRFVKRAGAAADVEEQTVYVDDAAVIRRVDTLQDMGMGPMPMTVEMTWIPVGGEGEGLILQSRTAKVMVPSPFGGEMEQTIKESFSYIDVEGLKIMNSVSSSMMGQSQTQTLEKLVINGKPVGGEAAAPSKG